MDEIREFVYMHDNNIKSYNWGWFFRPYVVVKKNGQLRRLKYQSDEGDENYIILDGSQLYLSDFKYNKKTYKSWEDIMR